ncbi:MAG: cysteine--tRNA ligase [Christensenellales bacterium]|jgi:cysteinyl-tRNA synthetase
MKIYNHDTHQKEEFIPVEPGKVKIYSCGPTVYNYFHIGNARPFILFDTLRRYFQYRGYDVTFVQNFTDIDDKMIQRADEESVTVKELGERFIREYFIDADALNIKRADVHPRASEHIGPMIRIIKGLEDKGLAYSVDGDVYFDTQAFDGYGKLSGQSLEDLEAGARIDVDEKKKHPMDFALWKAKKPGEPSWDSPWGQGRPGWHIECSAMSMKYLGETIDIHCGGQDLLFPHHENEVAQSEGLTGKPFARYWMHNGYINVDNRKMSKSLGNFFTVRDITGKYDPETVRLFMLSAHYRSPISFSEDVIEQNDAALKRLYNSRSDLEHLLSHCGDGAADEAIAAELENYRGRFVEAMDDDLNTAGAVGVIFDLVYYLNTTMGDASTKGDIRSGLDMLKELCDVLGLLYKETQVSDPKVLELLEKRAAARAAKDWNASDALRDQLADLGYAVEDTAQGQKVKPL